MTLCPECAKAAGFLSQHAVSVPTLLSCTECKEVCYCFLYEKPKPPPEIIPIKDRPLDTEYCPNDGVKLELNSRSETDEFLSWQDCPKCHMPWEVLHHYPEDLSRKPGDSFSVTFTYWK